jgi:negative regulator of sigma E activity
MSLAGFGQRQSHRKVATQSHRSTERELYDSGTAGMELHVKELCGPSRDTVARQRRETLARTRNGRDIGVTRQR